MQTINFKNIEIVRQTVADYFGVSLASLNMRRRCEPLVTIRHCAMLLCVELCSASRAAVGLAFSREHSNVTHSILSVKRILETDTYWALNFLQCSLLCKRALGIPTSSTTLSPLVNALKTTEQRNVSVEPVCPTA